MDKRKEKVLLRLKRSKKLPEKKTLALLRKRKRKRKKESPRKAKKENDEGPSKSQSQFGRNLAKAWGGKDTGSVEEEEKIEEEVEVKEAKEDT